MSSKTKVRLFVGVIAAAMFSTTVMAQQAKTDTASTTTIGGITDLQRRVLVAELNKKLRDANAVDKGSAGSGTSTFPSAPVPGGAIVSLPSPRKKVSAPIPPKEDIRVVAISGVGTALQATLSNGQMVKVGQKFSKNGETWEAVWMNSGLVRFKQCGDKAACKEVTLPVVSS